MRNALLLRGKWRRRMVFAFVRMAAHVLPHAWQQARRDKHRATRNFMIAPLSRYAHNVIACMTGSRRRSAVLPLLLRGRRRLHGTLMYLRDRCNHGRLIA